LLAEAQKRGAEVVATVCPLCQFNLDVFQKEARTDQKSVSIPVLYFSQLMALALGAPANAIGLQRSLVPIKPILAKKEIAYA
jgi:heterodisulfide reductase subunit B